MYTTFSGNIWSEFLYPSPLHFTVVSCAVQMLNSVRSARSYCELRSGYFIIIGKKWTW